MTALRKAAKHATRKAEGNRQHIGNGNKLNPARSKQHYRINEKTDRFGLRGTERAATNHAKKSPADPGPAGLGSPRKKTSPERK